MSIFSQLKKIAKGYSYHTPGHKGKLCSLDGTEIEDIFPGDCIERAQAAAARHFGAKNVRFLVNGSSIGVKSMIMSVGGDVLAPVNRHRSADEGAALAGVKLTFIENTLNDGLPMPITAEMIEKACAADKNIKAALVVSPDYFGFAADLVKIRKVCDKWGIYMLVDAAHGAHFASRDSGEDALFPLSASRIADACNMSAHKTMRAYTQTAYLAVNSDALLVKTDEALKLLGTTSPSYIFMGQLEKAVEYEEKHARKYDALSCEIRRISGGNFIRIKNDDPMRVVVDFSPCGLTGAQAVATLRKRGVYAEMASGNKAVFIFTLSDGVRAVRKLAGELKRL